MREGGLLGRVAIGGCAMKGLRERGAGFARGCVLEGGGVCERRGVREVGCARGGVCERGVCERGVCERGRYARGGCARGGVCERGGGVLGLLP